MCNLHWWHTFCTFVTLKNCTALSQSESSNFFMCIILWRAVFTLEDEQIVWTDKSSQTNNWSGVQTGRTNTSTNKSSDIWPSGKTIFPKRFARTSRRQYGINSHQTDKCQTICSSSSVKTANEISAQNRSLSRPQSIGIVWQTMFMKVCLKCNVGFS